MKPVSTSFLLLLGLTLAGTTVARAQVFTNIIPGTKTGGSSNVHVIAHLPLDGAGHTADITIEQELSRPYVYTAQDGQPFSEAYVQGIASDAAKKPYEPVKDVLPERWTNLGYDQYRDIRYRNDHALWRGEGRKFELQLLPLGWLYKDPVAINLVDGGVGRPSWLHPSTWRLPPHHVRPLTMSPQTAPGNRRKR